MSLYTHSFQTRAMLLLASTALAIVPVAGLAEAKSPPLPGKRTSLSHVTFVAFDTETTGFSPSKDRIVEVGAVKFRNGVILEEKNWLINPKRSIPYWAKRVHGITDEMVKDKPGFAEVYPEFREFIGGSVLLAHNAGFDVTFLTESIQRDELKKPKNRVIDSLTLFRGWFPDSESFSLEALADHLDIKGAGFHRALADSMYIYAILNAGLSSREAKIQTLGDLEKHAKVLEF